MKIVTLLIRQLIQASRVNLDGRFRSFGGETCSIIKGRLRPLTCSNIPNMFSHIVDSFDSGKVYALSRHL